MRFTFEHINVEVRNSTEGDERTFLITFPAPANDFPMTDHLQQRGVIEPLDSQFKQAARNATTSYLRAADSLVSLLASTSKQTRKHRTIEGETSGMRLVRVRRLK
ncbi:MAG: hypothetical protein ACREBG_02895 [Pyrinomonadaceae bacterium]